MNVVKNTPEELEILIEIPRFIVLFMTAPIALAGGLFTLALLLGGEFVNALTTGAVIAGLVFGGRYFLTQRTRLWLDAREGTVRILRTTMFEEKRQQLPLEHLDSASVAVSRRHERSGSGSSGSTSRPTSTLHLLFTNTRPATEVPLTGWAVSGGGAGMLANAINDWLRAHHERAEGGD
ncbi:MAG: hypothetical protein V2J42_03100 [Wenzhouxiangella sp.]|jgi:hypothetical protein|nr:hypothetical protein [Wenzhouxiangella sp.]